METYHVWNLVEISYLSEISFMFCSHSSSPSLSLFYTYKSQFLGLKHFCLFAFVAPNGPFWLQTRKEKFN